MNRLWLALCNVYVCVERSFVKFVYTIYRNDMVFFLTPYTSKNQVARGMFAFIESNKSMLSQTFVKMKFSKSPNAKRCPTSSSLSYHPDVIPANNAYGITIQVIGGGGGGGVNSIGISKRI